MARLSLEQKIDQLDSLNLADPSSEDLALLLQAIRAKQNRLVEKAVKRCREHYRSEQCSELKSAFHYFAKKPEKDKGCLAKNAIVRCLFELDYLDDDFYSQAIQLRQAEPVWGGSVDTAVELRCWAALGLTLSHNSRIVFQLIQLLHDEEPQARLGAVKAISCIPNAQAELLLREKVLDGDEDAYIIGECFHQLMTIEPDYSLEFISPYLNHSREEWVEYAALAIAENHDVEALNLLTTQLEKEVIGVQQKYLINAIALHRSKAALEYLLEHLQQAGQQQALTIIESLRQYCANSEVKQRLALLIAQAEDPLLQQAFDEHWGG